MTWQIKSISGKCQQCIARIWWQGAKRKELKRVLKFNVRAKMINLLEENIGEDFSDLGFGKGFSKSTQKSRIIP